VLRSPLTDYDTWACLTPGFLILATGDHILNYGWIWRETWTTTAAIFAIASAYIIGQTCSSIANLVIERGLAHRVLYPPSVVLIDKEAGRGWARALFRQYYRPLPAPAPDRILERARQAQIPGTGEAVFQWAYAAARENNNVSNKLSIFLNQYGMARNTSFAAFLCALGLTWSAWNERPSDWWWAAAATLSAVTLLYRFLKNYRLFTAEIYRHIAFEVSGDAR
jgi:hypothetical protein